jgi:E3 ubiquitin-protein ligase HERC2
MNGSSHSVNMTPPAQAPPRDSETQSSNKKSSTSAKAPGRPSLSKIVLSLESSASQQHALQQILNALQIVNAREALVAALAPHHTAVPVKGTYYVSLVLNN